MKHYYYNDIPPAKLSISIILQTLVIGMANFSFLILLFKKGNLSQVVMLQHLQWMIVAYAVSIAIQCFKSSPGSGYFMPSTSPAIYVGPAMLAITNGGLPLMLGMMVFAGLCELMFAFILDKIRFAFPKEIAGLALFAVGLQVGIIGFKNAIALHPEIQAVVHTLIMLTIYAACSIWGKGAIKNLAILIATIVGLLLIFLLPIPGVVHDSPSFLENISWLGLPSIALLKNISVSFDLALFPVFLFAAYAATIRTIGVFLIAREYENQKKFRPDFKLMKKAVLGDSLSCIFSSIVSGLGLNVAPITTTLSINARCTSKIISWGVLFSYLLISCSPKLIGYFCLMPNNFIGVILLCYSILLMMSGLKILDARKFETREILSVGISIVAIISLVAYPDVFKKIPNEIRYLFSSPLSLSLSICLTLTLLFAFKNKKEVILKVESSHGESKKKWFIEKKIFEIF